MRRLFILAFAFAFAGVALGALGCSKRDDDIARLETRLDDAELTIARLRKKVAALEEARLPDEPKKAKPPSPRVDSPEPPAAVMAAPLGTDGAGLVPQVPRADNPMVLEIEQGIVRKSPTEFVVERSVLNKVLENQAELMRSARIVPEQEGGKVVGIRLFGVRAGTLMAAFGFENGDRVEKMNGTDLTNPQKTLDAFAELKTAKHVEIEINRRGKATKLEYTVVH